MNSKLLYAATLAISLISTFAMADEAPLTRAHVNAETRQSIVDGTLQRTDYDTGAYRPQTATSSVTRQQVVIERAQAEAAHQALIGPDANAIYNPFGTQVLETSTLARSEVKREVLAAAAAGTLQRTDYDDAARPARTANPRVASGTLAQRFKAKFSKAQS